MDKAKVELITIPKIFDNGFLFFAQNENQVPFLIRRIYYILQANTKFSRGYHAHHKTQQVLFCIQGSIRIVIDDGHRKKTIILDKPEKGIYLGKMIWHEMHDFKKDTILLVLASRKFDPRDYIREYGNFLELVKKDENSTS